MRRALAQVRLPTPKDAYIPFRGGLDTETPGWDLKPGFVREGENFELGVSGGYLPTKGYERFSGQPAPSEAVYSILEVTVTGSFSVSDVVTGAVSGAVGTVVVVVAASGADPAYLVLTKVTGTYQAAEDLEVSATVEGTAIAAQVTSGGATAKLDVQYQAAAADLYRADIAAVPGEGSVLGVEYLAGSWYAWRNKSGGATAGMYKATTSGWTEVSLGRELAFTSGGTFEILDGAAITGATSGATATVGRVVLTSGTWAGGDAAGFLYFASQTGTFQSENLNVGGNLNVATIGGDSSAITLLPSGRYVTDVSNFNGAFGVDRMYGADGVNKGFEFDGTTFARITTGMAVDAPVHCIVHAQHLFFAFGPSLQNSPINAPHSPWVLRLGSTEIRVDSDITGFMIEPGVEGNASLSVWSENRIHVLYGTSNADWNLIQYREEVGAMAYTIQQVGYTLVADTRGITSLRTVQEHGNFQHAHLSRHIQRHYNARRAGAIASCIARDKNQYRLFFGNGEALYTTMERSKLAGITPVTLGVGVSCAVSRETASGERIFVGSTDGFVYELDKGNSRDGENNTGYMSLHFTNDNIRYEKSFLSPVTIEARGDAYAEIAFTYELDYAQSDRRPQPNEQSVMIDLSSSSTWDQEGLKWDEFFWDGLSLRPLSDIRFRGLGENVSFIMRWDDDYSSPTRLTGIHYHYLVRRAKRGH